MRFPKLTTADDLRNLIGDVGFIPLFDGTVKGFSVYSLTRGDRWWTGDDTTDPWQWRIHLAAEGRIAYGKLLEKKSAFVSREWYPVFANARRSGYDFDARYEDGKARSKEKNIMDLFLGTKKILPSSEIRMLAGFGREGASGFEGVMTALQMQTYLCVRGMECRRSKTGEEYGWPVALVSTPEALFGAKFVRSAYREEPEKSKERLITQLSGLFPGIEKPRAERFLR
jgi:hypothetical protein